MPCWPLFKPSWSAPGSPSWHLAYNTPTVNSSDHSSEYADARDTDVFWSVIRPADEPIRHRWFLPTVVVILTLSVPWYLPPETGDRLVGGLPLWTWITVVCGAALAVVTAWASLRLWRNEPDGGRGAGDEP